MLHTIQLYFLLFISYAFFGWCMEVICKLIQYKRFINRGFLIGPYCPIYGWGALLIALLLRKYINDPLVLFIFAIIICSILEYMTSYIMEKIFHARWWDYSTRKFNLNGRICLGTMLPFGFLGMLMMYIINPFLFDLFNNFNNNLLTIISTMIFTIFILDNIISAEILTSVRKNNKVLDKDNTEEMARIVREKIKSFGWAHRRLLKAFPNVNHIGIILKDKTDKFIDKINENQQKYTKKQQKVLKRAEKNISKLKKKYDEKIKSIKIKTDIKLKTGKR